MLPIAFRANGQITTTAFSTSASVLAVDASKIADVAWFRDDFAGGKSVDDLVRLLLGGSQTQNGLPLPDDAEGLSVWVQPAGIESGSNLWARLRDSNGTYFDVSMGGLDAQGWTRLDTDLSPVIAAGRRFSNERQQITLQPPFSLQAFQVTIRTGAFGSGGMGALFFGSLDAVTPQGTVNLAGFDSPEGWSVIEDFFASWIVRSGVQHIGWRRPVPVF